jgi:hypothetical protein
MHDHLTAAFHRLHGRLAGELRTLDDAGCNWVPVEGANSVATIVVHLLGSEAEAFGHAPDRDRPAEFVPAVRTRRELLDRLADADAAPPPNDDVDPCSLLANDGHANEHLGQLLLTAQLYRDARRRARG